MTALESNKKSFSGFQIVITLLLSGILLAVIAFILLYINLNTKTFKPVTLSDSENLTLQSKLKFIDDISIGSHASNDKVTSPSPTNKHKDSTTEPFEPEVYSELNAKREIQFSERELNALLAKNSELAEKIAIDLAPNLASAKILVPLDPEFPFLGGKTLKLSAGLELGYTNARPIVKLIGVSLWGVPVPNAWLGGIKNIDLINEFGTESGFWKAFADGVENLKVEDQRILIKLKE